MSTNVNKADAGTAPDEAVFSSHRSQHLLNLELSILMVPRGGCYRSRRPHGFIQNVKQRAYPKTGTAWIVYG